jgi:hypothetical protein
MNAQEAIARSISHNEIVHAEYDEDMATDLELRADDSAVNGDTYEFWGQDDDGNEWRVHLG